MLLKKKSPDQNVQFLTNKAHRHTRGSFGSGFWFHLFFFIVVFWRIRKKKWFFLLQTNYWVLFLFSDLRNNDDNDEVIHLVFFFFKSFNRNVFLTKFWQHVPPAHTCFFLGGVDQKIIMMSPLPVQGGGVRTKYCFTAVIFNHSF